MPCALSLAPPNYSRCSVFISGKGGCRRRRVLTLAQSKVALWSFASIAIRARVRLSPDFRHARRLSDSSRSAKTGCEQLQQTLPLFDHPVGAGEQRRRNYETERSRRDQVDNQIELGRLLDRQVGGFGPT